MRVRLASESEIVKIAASASRLFVQAPWLPPPESSELEAHIKTVCRQGWIVAALSGDRIVGSLGIRRGFFEWSREPQLFECWVVATERGAAMPMIAAAAAIADKLERDLWTVTLANPRPAALARLYRRAGFAPAGAGMVYRAKR